MRHEIKKPNDKVNKTKINKKIKKINSKQKIQNVKKKKNYIIIKHFFI